MKFSPRARLFAAAFMAVAACASTAAIDPQVYLDEVKFLSDAKLKGRGTGSPELEKAAAYIAAENEDCEAPIRGAGRSWGQPAWRSARERNRR